MTDNPSSYISASSYKHAPFTIAATKKYPVCMASGFALALALLSMETSAAMLAAQNTPKQGARVPVLTMASSMAQQNLVQKVTPDLCAESARDGYRKSAIFFHAVIGISGRFAEITHAGGNPEVDRVVIEALQQWRYRPFEQESKPIEIETTIGVAISCGPANRDLPFAVSSGVAAGQILRKVPIAIPHVGKDAHVSGANVMQVDIDEHGRVSRIEHVSGPAILSQPVMDAVKQWEYRPFEVDGIAVPVRTTVTVNISFGG